jgi:transaldolase
MHAIHALRSLGQSTWLDHLDRRMLRNGQLKRMIEDDALAGVTSNPTIFQKAIAASPADYDEVSHRPSAREPDSAVLEQIEVCDVALACDHFLGVHERTGDDGFVSIEVSPLLARNTAATMAEASRLWTRVARPNVMVKIPATREGLPAIRRCLAAGININVTLLFSLERYREVVDAHLSALEDRLSRSEPIARVASVASVFVSRIDAKIDRLLERASRAGKTAAPSLKGRIAIANAKLAYEEYQRTVRSERWQRLAAKGAAPQRLLWGSTAPKDPVYPPTYYVDALAGPSTIDTMTVQTFEAYIRAYAHGGSPRPRLMEDVRVAHEEMDRLASLGIDLGSVTDELEREGVDAFSASFDRVLSTIHERRASVA